MNKEQFILIKQHNEQLLMLRIYCHKNDAMPITFHFKFDHTSLNWEQLLTKKLLLGTLTENKLQYCHM